MKCWRAATAMPTVLGLIELFILLDLCLIGGAAAIGAASSCVIMGAGRPFGPTKL